MPAIHPPTDHAIVGRRALWSGSSAHRAMLCPPSAVLPKVRREGIDADSGSCIHDHLADRAEMSLDVALDKLDAHIRKWGLPEKEGEIVRARCQGFTFVPPAGAVTELGLCLLESGEVVRVEGGRGDYELPDDGLMPMTIDLIWSEPERLEIDPTTGHIYCPKGSLLFVVEYKSGDDVHVPPVEANPQALGGALLAARYTGAERVVPAIVYVRKGDGLWDYLPNWLEEEALADIERELRETGRRVDALVEELAKGGELQPSAFTTGPQCTYCDAQAHCPPKTAALKRFLGEAVDFRDGALREQQATLLAEQLPQGEAFLRQVKEALKCYVAENGPIPLADGRVWGPNQHETRGVRARVALPVLQDELGDFALDTCSITRESIERAVAGKLEADNVQRGKAAAMRRVMGKLETAGAIVRRTEDWWQAHTPRVLEVVPNEESLKGDQP